jgi:hypothetical protein
LCATKEAYLHAVADAMRHEYRTSSMLVWSCSSTRPTSPQPGDRIRAPWPNCTSTS